MRTKRKAAYAELKAAAGRRADYMDRRKKIPSVRYKWWNYSITLSAQNKVLVMAAEMGLKTYTEQTRYGGFITVLIPDEFEYPAVKLVRERYGFHPDTPREIMADRCEDDGDEELAQKILTLP